MPRRSGLRVQRGGERLLQRRRSQPVPESAGVEFLAPTRAGPHLPRRPRPRRVQGGVQPGVHRATPGVRRSRGARRTHRLSPLRDYRSDGARARSR